MARNTYAVNSFNAGKVSPLLDSRVDVAAVYPVACRTLLNAFPTSQGPADKRRGSRFVVPRVFRDKQSRLIDFIFSDIDSYKVELAEGRLRFFTQRGPVLESTQNITDITAADPAVVTITAHGYSNNDMVYITGVVGMTQANGRYFRISNVTTDTFELTGVDSSGYTAYSSGGTAARIYSITAPWDEDELFDVKFAQKDDIMYMVHPLHHPQKLSRIANANWTIADMDNKYGPVLERAEGEARTLTASGTSGSVTITASTDIFEAGHVGSLWELRDTSGTVGTRGYFRITGYTNPTTVTATVQKTLPTTSATTYWYEAAWSGPQGYPRAIDFFEQRLFLAGTAENPLGVDGSMSNDRYETFDAGTGLADEAIKITISGRSNTIQWLKNDGQFLVAGTFGGLAFIGASNTDQAFSATNVKSNNGTSFGSSAVQGVQFNNTVKYLTRSRTKMLQAQYDDLSLSYAAEDLTVFTERILRGQVRQMTVQEEPATRLWCAKDDGTIAAVNQEVAQKVVGWTDIETAEGDSYQSVSIIPGQVYDEIWTVVERVVDGSTDGYIEYFEPDRDLNYFVDCGVEYDGTISQTLTLSAATVGTGRTFTAGGGTVFTADDVGRRIYGKDGGRATITGYSSATVVTCEITTAFPSTSVASAGWYLTTNTLTNLWHLEGRDVDILGDNAYAGRHTVVNGSVTTDNQRHFGLLYAGLPYEADVEPMLIEPGGDREDPGTSQGKKKRVSKLILKLLNTGAGLKVGPSFDDLTTVPIREPSDPMDAATPFWGQNDRPEYVEAPFPGDWDYYGRVCVRHDLPLPFTLISIHIKNDVNPE